jgi:predicted transcriptional regulator
MPEVEQADLTALTVQLLSAYVSNNTVPSENLAGLIETTRSALAGKTEPAAPPEPEFPPAVTVRKSLASKDHILSLIDGRPYKALKRHLATNGLTPAEYRERYGLPKDYPMVAPNYSEHRREVAKKLGLGRRIAAKPSVASAEVEAASPAEPIATPQTKAPRVAKPRTAPKRAAKTAKPAEVSEAPVAAPAETAPVDAVAAPKPRGRKPKTVDAAVDTPAPKRGRKKDVTPAEAVVPTSKRARKPKVAAETA